MTSTLLVRDTFAGILETGLAPPTQRERETEGDRRRVRDGTGNGQAEYDWYFALSPKDRERYRRWMRPTGLAPDEWAHTMGYDDLELAMSTWCAAVDHQRVRTIDRAGIDWDAEEPEPEEEPASVVIVRERVLGLSDLADYVGAKRATAYKWQARGKLPMPDMQVSGADAWYLSTVQAWHEAKSAGL